MMNIEKLNKLREVKSLIGASNKKVALGPCKFLGFSAHRSSCLVVMDSTGNKWVTSPLSEVVVEGNGLTIKTANSVYEFIT